jgi:hypothetical protein
MDDDAVVILNFGPERRNRTVNRAGDFLYQFETSCLLCLILVKFVLPYVPFLGTRARETIWLSLNVSTFWR